MFWALLIVGRLPPFVGMVAMATVEGERWLLLITKVVFYCVRRALIKVCLYCGFVKLGPIPGMSALLKYVNAYKEVRSFNLPIRYVYQCHGIMSFITYVTVNHIALERAQLKTKGTL